MVTMACRREVERPPVFYARAVLGAGGATSHPRSEWFFAKETNTLQRSQCLPGLLMPF